MMDTSWDEDDLGWVNHCIATADDRAREVNAEYDNTQGEEQN